MLEHAISAQMLVRLRAGYKWSHKCKGGQVTGVHKGGKWGGIVEGVLGRSGREGGGGFIGFIYINERVPMLAL